MPVGICPTCARRYVLEHPDDPRNHCHECLTPLEALSPAESPPSPHGWSPEDHAAATGQIALTLGAAAEQVQQRARRLREERRALRERRRGRGRLVMIPDFIMETLLSHLVDAIRYATSGEWSSGYEALLQGLRQAQGAREAQAPWAAELVKRYQQVIEAFELRYDVKLR
jgi:hypothetical protein